jgi:hypothetical protein
LNKVGGFMKRSGFAVTLVGIGLMSLPYLHGQEPVAWRAVTFDFYDRGIHLAELSILDIPDPSGSFTECRKDVRRNAWPDVDGIYLRHRAGSSSTCCRDDLISEVLCVPAQGDRSPVTTDGAECGREGAGADGVTGLWRAQDGTLTPGSGSRLRR